MALDAATREKIRTQFPSFAYLLDIPEIANLLAKASTEGWDVTRLQSQLYATRWWKSRSQTSRQWDTLVATDPGEVARQRTQRRQEVYNEARRLGINGSSWDYALIAENSLRQGWVPSQITQAIVRLTKGKPGGGLSAAGEVRGTMDQIRALTKQYAHNVSTSTLQNWAQMIAMGQMTMDGIKAFLVTAAKHRLDPSGENVTLQRGLDMGLSVRDIYANVIETVASELEIDPSGIDLASGHYGKLLDFEDEKGRQRPMTQTEATKWARNQHDWQKTNTAREAYTGLANAMTKNWGLR